MLLNAISHAYGHLDVFVKFLLKFFPSFELDSVYFPYFLSFLFILHMDPFSDICITFSPSLGCLFIVFTVFFDDF